MSLEFCLIGTTPNIKQWQESLELIGNITSFSNMNDALGYSLKTQFSVTFLSTECFTKLESDQIFDLRKHSHSRIVLLGSLKGFKSNFLYEYAIFDWCETELDTSSIQLRSNWYRDQILGPINKNDDNLINTNKIQLTRKEEVILNCLYAQKVIHVDELQNLLWKGVSVTSHVLDVHLCNLRKKIKPFHKTIKRERNGKIYLQEYCN